MKNNSNKSSPAAAFRPEEKCSLIYFHQKPFVLHRATHTPLFVPLLINACDVWGCEKHLHFKGQRLGEGKI